MCGIHSMSYSSTVILLHIEHILVAFKVISPDPQDYKLDLAIVKQPDWSPSIW